MLLFAAELGVLSKFWIVILVSVCQVYVNVARVRYIHIKSDVWSRIKMSVI